MSLWSLQPQFLGQDVFWNLDLFRFYIVCVAYNVDRAKQTQQDLGSPQHINMSAAKFIDN